MVIEDSVIQTNQAYEKNFESQKKTKVTASEIIRELKGSEELHSQDPGKKMSLVSWAFGIPNVDAGLKRLEVENLSRFWKLCQV